MTYSLIFNSNIFDWKSEPPNDCNEINGISLGQYLSPLFVQKSIQVTDIESEDWGWYLDATLDERTYMVGFIIIPKNAGESSDECICHVEKSRSFIEIITGKNKMQDDDPMLTIVHKLISEIKDVEKVTLDKR